MRFLRSAGGAGVAWKARWAVFAGSRWIDMRMAGSRRTSSLWNCAAVIFFARACRESGADGCEL